MRYTGDAEPCLSRAMRPWRRSAVSRVLLIHFKCFKLPPSDGSGTLKMPDDDGISSRALYCTAITSAETWSEPLISTEPEWSRSAAVLRGDFAVLSWRQTVSSGQLLLCPTQSNTQWLTKLTEKPHLHAEIIFAGICANPGVHATTQTGWLSGVHGNFFYEDHVKPQQYFWGTLSMSISFVTKSDTLLTNLYQIDNMAML